MMSKKRPPFLNRISTKQNNKLQFYQELINKRQNNQKKIKNISNTLKSNVITCRRSKS